MRRILTLLALTLVSACVAPPSAPAPPPPAAPVALPPPPAPTPLASDWRDWPLTPGVWSYERDSRGTRAMFGLANADARLVLRCDRADRQVYLSRAGAQTGALTIRTSSTVRAVPVRPTGGTLPYVAAALGVRDPLLDAMAFSRGRFVVEQAGDVALVVPAWAEIGRVIEDCRG